MKITFLVGNGFDISLGLKTSYNHFYQWYCKTPTPDGYPHIQMFKDNINDEINSDKPEEERTWSDLELGLGKYSSNFSPSDYSDYMDCFNDVQTHIAEYIGEQCKQFDATHLDQQQIEVFRDSIYNFYDLSDSENAVISKMIHPYNNEISFITFNYSNTLESAISQLKTDVLATWSTAGGSRSCRINPTVLHVNGALSKNPILGVDDALQIENAQMRNNSLVQQILVKNKCVNALGRLWHTNAERLISESNIICIYGMSLGKSDARWWKYILNYLYHNTSVHVIVYWYEPVPISDVEVVRIIKTSEEVKDNLLSYTTLSDRTVRERIKRQIHVKINTNRILKLPTFNQMEALRIYPALLAYKNK